MNHKVVIIGAGAAGYAAACRLLEKGITNIKILEAQNRIGGRISSVQFGDSKVDLGAQWCHGEVDNVVYKMVEKLDLLQPSFNNYDEKLFVNSTGKFVDSKVSAKLSEIAYSIGTDHEEMKNYKGSFGDYFIERFNEKVNNELIDKNTALQILDWFQKFTNSINASSTWFDISAKGLTEYKECEGNITLSWKDTGYNTVFSVLKKKIPDASEELPVDDKIEFNKEVTQINWQCDEQNGVKVVCQDGAQYIADYVILTVSLGVLKENYKKLFIPELPNNKKNAIEGLAIGAVNKIFLKFKTRWWPKDTKGFSFIWSENDSGSDDFVKNGSPMKDGKSWLESIFGFYTIDNNPNVLMGWVVGPRGPEIEKLSNETISTGCLFLLQKFLGKHYEISALESILRSDWGTNPYFRGSYSYRSMKTELLNTSASDLAMPLTAKGKQVLLFAGEGTHKHFYSTVHGAIESGFREADRIVDFCKNQIILPTSRKCTIAIIGAGISGLSAAKALLEAGCKDILLIEAQDLPGGRIKTIKFDKGHLDLGAQWLHGTQNELWKISNKHNLFSNKVIEEGKGVFLREDGYIFDNFLVEKVNFVFGQILEECEKFTRSEIFPVSIGSYLSEKFSEYLQNNQLPEDLLRQYMELYDWNIRFQVIDNSCENLNQLSAKSWGEYSCEADIGQTHISYAQGYSSVIDVLVNCLPNGTLLTSCPVKNINWDNNSIKILCQEDYIIEAKGVIVTPSLGVLKATKNTLFTPNLPVKISKTIDAMGFKGICKIFLAFATRWWGDSEGFQIVWKWDRSYGDDWTRYLTGFDLVQEQKNMLLGWVGGRGAELVEKISENTIGITCTNLLKKFTKNSDVPFPVKVIRTTWNSNPWIRGGYSHPTTACDSENLGANDLSTPITDSQGHIKVMLAGEACHSGHFSTVHGAYESGQTQALVLLNNLKSQN